MLYKVENWLDDNIDFLFDQMKQGKLEDYLKHDDHDPALVRKSTIFHQLFGNNQKNKALIMFESDSKKYNERNNHEYNIEEKMNLKHKLLKQIEDQLKEKTFKKRNKSVEIIKNNLSPNKEYRPKNFFVDKMIEKNIKYFKKEQIIEFQEVK